MSKRQVFTRLVLLAVVFSMLAVICCVPAMAETITICDSGCNLTGIQGAIDNESGGLQGEIPITAPAVIDSPGQYRLMNDLTNSTADTAILITSSNVFLDGDGHTLGGALNRNAAGVLAGNVSTGLENITLTNLTITGWGFGIEINGVTTSMISNSRADGNQVGITVGRSPNSTVSNCSVTDNIPLEEQGIFFGGTGINIGDSPGTCILGSTVSHNGWGEQLPFVGGYGILSLNNTGLLVLGCVIDENVNTGIWNQDSKDTIVRGNQIHHNSGNGGIFMTAIAEDPVINATIADNNISESGSGIWLIQNDYLLENNTVNGCGTGILLSDSRNATLSGNVMAGNDMNLGVEGNSRENFRHQIDTSNTVDGRPVFYLFGQPGAVVDGSTGAGVVFGISCPDLTVRDLTLQNNEYGVFLSGSDGAVIQNVTATDNNIGIDIQECDGARIETCTAGANALNGLLITGSADVRITGTNALLNSGGMAGTGIAVENCPGILIQQVNASQNNIAGVELGDTDRACLVDMTVNANGEVGLILGGDSNQVTGCHFSDNQGPGIGMLDSTNATIWNNFFSNEVNVDISQGNVTGSSWNVDKTAGSNIVNGPFIGGNYWASPDGTGFSQTHPDRGDGFCNAPYVLDENNKDLLPLHTHTPKPPFSADFSVSPTSGTVPLTVQFTDESIGNPTWFTFNFGDGTISTSRNPVHTYKFPGTYSISLTVMKFNSTSNAIESASTTRQNVVMVSNVLFDAPAAKFTASPTQGPAPLTVTFTDQSTGNPMFFNYNFGDGFNATGPDQVHTYRHAGIYDVTLTVLKNDAAHAAFVGNSSVRTGLIVVEASAMIPHVRAGLW